MGNLAERLFFFLQRNRGLPFRAMTVFNYLLEAALAGGVMILLMLLVRRFLRGHLGSRAVYVAWLLVAVRLLVPLAIPNPLMNELRPTWSQDAAARPVADQVRVRFNDALNDFAYELNSRQYDAAQAEGMSRQEYNRSLEGNTFPEVLAQFGYANSYGWTGKWFLLGYGAVALGTAAWMTAANASFRRRLKKSRAGTLSGDALEAYNALCAEMGMKPLPVYLADPLSGACLVGAVRPAIYLPLSMKPEDIPYALRHELCHYRARDNWWSLLRLVCCTVQWFNPLVWIAARCVRTDCELACDDRVAAMLDDDDRRAYAEVLLTSAARRSQPGVAVAATGMTMNGKRLKQRIAAIIASKAVRRRAAQAFLCIACAVAVMAFCTAESDPMSQRRPGFDNDRSNVPTVEEVYGSIRPVDGNATLVQRAAAYMNNELLGGRGYYSASVVETEDGASAVASGSGAYFGDVSVLHVDTAGQIVKFRGRNAGADWVPSDRTTPPNTDEAMQDFLTALSESCFSGAAVTDYTPGTAMEKGEKLAYSFRASIGGAAYDFLFDLDWHRFDRIERVDAPETAMLHDQLDAVQALWDAVSAIGIDDPGHAMTFVQWQESTGEWLVTMYVDELAPEAYQRALTMKFGEQPRWTLELRVPLLSGEAGELTCKPIVYTQVEASADAPSGVTNVYTETYNLIAGEELMRDDTLPMGVPYTIVAQASEALLGSAYDEYRDFVLIRYESPRYGGAVVDRWTHDPETWRLREVGVISTPVPEAHRETLVYRGGDKEIAVPAVNKVNDPGFSGFTTAPETALSVEAALAVAVRAVEEAYGVPAENLLVYQISYGYHAEAPDFAAPYWQFDIYITDYMSYEVILHDPDGEILYIAAPGQGNG